MPSGRVAARVQQVVDAEDVEALDVAVVQEVPQQVEVLLTGGVHDELPAAGPTSAGAAVDEDRARSGLGGARVRVVRGRVGRAGNGIGHGHRPTLRVMGWVWGMASTWTSAPAPRVLAAPQDVAGVDAACASVVMAWMSVSGVGGQPGA